jgi:hypothetical protein
MILILLKLISWSMKIPGATTMKTEVDLLEHEDSWSDNDED